MGASLDLTLDTQQIAESLPLARAFAAPARRGVAREGDAPFGRQHRLERGFVLADGLAHLVRQDTYRGVHPYPVTTGGEDDVVAAKPGP